MTTKMQRGTLEIGLECEYFVKDKKGNFVAAAEFGLPHDDCGYLAEIRSEPHYSVENAVYSLKAEEIKLNKRCRERKVKLIKQPSVIFPIEQRVQYIRKYGKNVHDTRLFGNISDVESRINPANLEISTAGIHVHFSEKSNEFFSGMKVIKFNQLNMPRIIHLMDIEFAKEINDASRQSGEYGLKPWGFEYRSLPNNIKHQRLIKGLEKVLSLI